MNGMRWRALAWCLVALTVAVGCVLEFRGGKGIETNVLALLPATERNPVAEQVAARMADGLGNRVVFLVGAPGIEAASQAARDFGERLRASGALRTVLVDLPPVDLRALARLYTPHRFDLLTPADRASLPGNSPTLADRLAQKLYAPPRMGLATPIDVDPFGLLDNWMASLPLGASRLTLQDGLLVTQEPNRTWVLVAGELPGSAYDPQAQAALVEAVAVAEQSLRAQRWEAQLLRAGMVFYAHDAREQAQHEFDMIGAGSLLGMLLLLYWVFRSLGPLVLGVMAVALGVGAACLATRWWFGGIHLITLVFGASLIGEAIDYAIQYFAARLGAGNDWQPMSGLKRIAPGLAAALATSLLGYGVLALSPFSALAQIGFFAAVGLTTAWLSVFFLLPAALVKPAKPRKGNPLAWPEKGLRLWRTRMGLRQRVALSLLIVLVSVPGWLRLHADDDIRLLISRPETLVKQEERMRELTGIGGGSQFFLVEGRDADETMEHEEPLVARLRQLLPSGTPVQAISAFVPSAKTQEANRVVYRDAVLGAGVTLDRVLANAGLREQVPGQLRAAFVLSEDEPLGVQDWLASPASIPLRQYWQGQTAHGFASVVPVPANLSLAQLQQAAQGLAGVTLVDKAGSVSALFGKYRKQSAFWLAGALALVYVVLALRYRPRSAAAVLFPTLLALAAGLGVLGYMGQPLTLFDNMGFMLVLGVGVNYAIFLREGGTSEVATMAGVLLSAGTTLLAYGLLSFSSLPALSGFGLTLLVGVGLAVLLSPMALPLPEKSAAGAANQGAAS